MREGFRPAMDRDVYVTEIARLFPAQGRWTEQDYFALPENQRIVELSNGEIIMPSPPTDEHQRIVMELAFALKQHVEAGNLGTVRIAPLAVRLWEGKIREPDVLFVSKRNRDRIGMQVYGPPDWIAEVISPGTRNTDEVDKLAEYTQAGVGEYWLVDPEAKSIRIYVLESGEYAIASTTIPGQITSSPTIPGFSLPADSLFG
jgi:Uma2 family endonuclease